MLPKSTFVSGFRIYQRPSVYTPLFDVIAIKMLLTPQAFLSYESYNNNKKLVKYGYSESCYVNLKKKKSIRTG